MQPLKVNPTSIAIELPEQLNVQKHWRVLKRRWLTVALVSGGVFSGVACFTVLQKPIYEAEGKLVFKLDAKQNLVGIKNGSAILQPLTIKSDPVMTQAEIIQSEPFITNTIRSLNLKDNQGKKLDRIAFLRSLNVRPALGTDILIIRYKDPDPERAAATVNQLMKAYLTKNVENARKDAMAAQKFILDQLPATEQAVNRAEANLRQFKEANGIVALEQEALASVKNLSDLGQQITQIQAELQQANARKEQLRAQVGMDTSTALKINTLNQSQGVQKALFDWQQADALLAKQRTLYRSPHPSVTQLEKQEQAAKAIVQERVAEILGKSVQVPTEQLQIGATQQEIAKELARAEVEQVALTQKLEKLVQSQSVFAARSTSLPGLEQTQRELYRRLEASQAIYKGLLTRLQEVQIAANQTAGDAEIVAQAEPPTKPTSPKVLLYLLAGGVLGLTLGLIVAFLMEFIDRSVRTMQQARELFQYTLLGVIPTVDTGMHGSDPDFPKLLTGEGGSFAAQEGYQMLQANLRFATSESLRSIVVTSATGKEGKSTVAANLAAAMAQVKQRVLLVDANLRTPSQHHVWNLTNQKGLSNVIVNQIEPEQAIQEVTACLHVLTAGSIPPNPVSLLDSSQMAQLVQRFVDDYDFVIFDTPSLSGTIDATVLNKMTDGTVLVVRPGTIDIATGTFAKEHLTQSGQTVLGMVINHFNAAKEPDSYFYHNKQENARSPDKGFAIK